jgi:hypothetical protein
MSRARGPAGFRVRVYHMAAADERHCLDLRMRAEEIDGRHPT